MPLHTADGSITSLKDWNQLQGNLAMDLIKPDGIDRDTDHHAVNKFVHLWCTCFA